MKILFFTGKGGVGKSTLSSAAAWQLSKSNRVLIISLDPAHNLGDIFNIRLNGKTRLTDTLYLKEIDLQKLTKNYMAREIDVLTQTYSYLKAFNLDAHFSVMKYSPGIEEYALLNSIEETIRTENGFDYIIFDTPPTGLTIRFMALPRVTLSWIDRLIRIRRKILEKQHTIHRIMGPLSKEATILNFDEQEDKILTRLQALEHNYRSLNEMLQGDNCSIVLVFNPDLLSLKESERLIEGLDELNLPLRLLIDNKVTKGCVKKADQIEADMVKLKSVPILRVSISKPILDGERTKLYDISENIASFL